MPETPDNIVPITGEDDKEAAKRYLEEYGQELVTILFTDLVDSTQLQSDLGNVESAKITDLHRGIVRDELEKSNGREIEWAGDSCLAVFSKPSEAVVFALRMQAEHARVRKTEKRLPTVRVGMHLGEIVVKQGDHKEDLYGLQVSEAARVMSIARGNQVFCTRAVFDSARSSLKGQVIDGIGDAVWVNYGAYLLKGSEEPVEICEIGSSEVAVMKAPEATDKVFPVLPGGNPAAQSSGTPKWAAAIIVLLMAGVVMLGIQLMGGSKDDGPQRLASTDEPIDSIAVLPFVNQSGEDDQEYFVDGMTGAITSELSKISSLKVIGRASAMTYKGSVKAPEEIAAELGVDGLITGTAFRAGDDVRITAELVDARTGAQEWSKEYDATMDNVLEVHSDVALAVSEAVETVVTPEEQARLSQSYDTDPAAYDEYLRGVARMGSRSHEGLRAAIARFERAVALDPKFAPAYARLADSHSLLGMYWYEDVDDVYPKAKEFALKAIELDENSSEAYTALGLVEGLYLLNLASAERLYLRALEIDPNYANAHMWYSNLLTWLGRNKEAIFHVDRLTELLPNDVVAQTQRALADFAVSDFEKATRFVDRLEKENPDHPVFNLFYGPLYSSTGDNEKGIVYARKAVDKTNRNPNYLSMLATFLARDGQLDEAKKLFAEIESRSEDSFISRDILARLHFSLGNDEIGFDLLSKARGEVFGLASARALPHYAFLHDDDRYWKLLDEMKLPLLPSSHPGYTRQEEWLQKKAAKVLLASQPKPVTRLSLELPEELVTVRDGDIGLPAFALSPDGSAIVFVGGARTSEHLRYQRLDSFESRVLRGTENAFFPFFSRDGQSVGFFSNGQLSRVSVNGGSPQSLAKTPRSWGAASMEDDSILFQLRDNQGIWKWSEANDDLDEIVPLLFDKGDRGHCFPRLLPDDDTLIFTSWDGQVFSKSNIVQYSLSTGKRKVIIRGGCRAHYVDSGHLVYASDGDLFAVGYEIQKKETFGDPVRVVEGVETEDFWHVPQFSISESGTLAYASGPPVNEDSELVWVSRDQTIAVISSEPKYYGSARVSPDGSKIAYFHHGANINIWTLDVTNGLHSLLTSDDGGEYWPVWLPDGEKVSFNSSRGTGSDPYLAVIGGTSSATRIPTGRDMANVVIRTWAPDEKSFVASIIGDDTGWDLVGFRLGEPGNTFPVAQTAGQDEEAEISRDGNWIAYTSDVSGRRELYVQTFPEAGTRIQVSNTGGTRPFWAPSGDQLYYSTLDNATLMSVELSTEPTLSATKPEKVLDSENLFITDIDPKEERFLAVRRPEPEAVESLKVILNFQEELKRLVPVSEKD